MEPDCILRQRPHNYCPSLAFIARATKNSLICFSPHCKSSNTCEALRHKQNPVQTVRHLMSLTNAHNSMSHPVPCKFVPNEQCSPVCETASRQILMNLLCVCICFCFFVLKVSRFLSCQANVTFMCILHVGAIQNPGKMTFASYIFKFSKH